MAIDLRTVLSPVIVGDVGSSAVTLQVSFSWGQRLGLLLRVDIFSERDIVIITWNFSPVPRSRHIVFRVL